MMEKQCPECGSNEDVMEWADGYICRNCGTEF